MEAEIKRDIRLAELINKVKEIIKQEKRDKNELLGKKKTN